MIFTLRLAAKKLAHFLCFDQGLTECDLQTCEYGAMLLLYTIMSTLGLLAVGLAIKRFTDTVMIIMTFYVNQTIGGGLHVSTHAKCFALMVVGVFTGLFLCSIQLTALHWASISMIGCYILMKCPLVLHPNKEYLQYKSAQLILHSRILTTIEGVLLLFLLYTDTNLLPPFSVAIVLAAASRLAAIPSSMKNKTI